MNDISVFSLKKKFKSSEKYVKSIASKILTALKKEKIVLEINLIDDEVIRKINKRYRGRDKPTDILSFPESKNFPHPESKLKHLGEIYLNLTNDLRQTTKLLIHGILHLLGYVHKKGNDRIKMEKKERQLLKFLMTNS